jgi:NAD(P)-dependent dehydrogenase (short-subunit alcohol dehydrogenase family)
MPGKLPGLSSRFAGLTTQQFDENSVPDQSGGTFLVTGANTGIGYETARVLAANGARVLLGCRSEQKANEALSKIRRIQPSAEVQWLPLDLASLESVRRAAQIVNEQQQLDVLINNAGVMMPPRSLTEDGFELQFGVNHLGHFALTGLLMQNLLRADAGRVVNVSSIAHRNGQVDFDDLHAERAYKASARYGMSKLANMLFTLSLDKRLKALDKPCIAVACHPGIAKTELSRHMPGLLVGIAAVLGPLFNTPAEGALPTLEAATSATVVGNDYYGPLLRQETARSSGKAKIAPQAKDMASAERLWEISESLTGVSWSLS